MLLPSVRRLALSDLDDSALRELIDHGESLLVDRKREPPPAPGFGAAVASFANTIGGWVLLGVDDDGSVIGYDPGDRVDVQSYLADRLRKEVDPLPPFVADRREIDGRIVIPVRVFESADSPHVVRGTGAVYVRTSKGKEPVDSHHTLMALAVRGRDAESEARTRIKYGISNRPPFESPQGDQGAVLASVLAAPLTVSPQFGQWPISSRGAEWLFAYAGDGAFVSPRARGIEVRVGYELVTFADSHGYVGLEYLQPCAQSLALHDIRRDHVRRLLNFVSSAFREGEAIGRALFELTIHFHQTPFEFRAIEHESRHSTQVSVSGEIVVPADEDDLHAEGLRIEREIGRRYGVQTWEQHDGDH